MKRKKRKIPTNIQRNIIKEVLQNIPRKYWKRIIENLIYKEDSSKYISYIFTESNDEYLYGKEDISIYTDFLPFIPADLTIKEFDFKPGTIVTHKKLGGYYVVENYITLDERYKEKYSNEDWYDHIINDGTFTFVTGISKSGLITTTDNTTGDIDQSIDIFNSTYHHYKKIDYAPKEGELLYYIQQNIIGNLSCKDEHKYFLQELMESKKVITIGDITNKKEYETWFKEY